MRSDSARGLHVTGATPSGARRRKCNSSPLSLCNPFRSNISDKGTFWSFLLSTRPLMHTRSGSCSAHAGYAPWDGVNALDAAFVAYAGISALRQQIRPEQRVHGVISGRDWTPNGSYLAFPHIKIKIKGVYADVSIRNSHSRLRKDVVVHPCGNAVLARAAARACGEMSRVRDFSFFSSSS